MVLHDGVAKTVGLGNCLRRKEQFGMMYRITRTRRKSGPRFNVVRVN